MSESVSVWVIMRASECVCFWYLRVCCLVAARGNQNALFFSYSFLVFDLKRRSFLFGFFIIFTLRAQSLAVFQDIATKECFERTSIILFLNKVDLLRQKIVTFDLSSVFPEFEGAPRVLFASSF